MRTRAAGPVAVSALPSMESLEPRLMMEGNPALDVSAAVDHGYEGVQYSLIASATTASEDAGDQIARWLIDWGDGSAVEEFATDELAPVMTHTYADDRAYEIEVIVEDVDGDQNVVEDADNVVNISIMDTVVNYTAVTQSSTYPGYSAENAFDGDTSGLLADAARTTEDVNPWWQVELSTTHDIGRINIWNVDAPNDTSLTNFWVFVTTVDPSSYTLGELTAEEQPDYVTYRILVAGLAGQPETLDLPDGVEGQYVRIQLAGEDRVDRLQLAEVEIIGLSHFDAVDDSGTTTDQDTPVTVDAPGVLANDQPYTYGTELSVLTQPAGSTGTIDAWNEDGSFTYNPNGQFDYLAEGETATDTFRYTLTDGVSQYDIGTVTIEITGINDAPIASDSTLTVAGYAQDDWEIGAVTASDVDNGDSLTYTILGGSGMGIFDIVDGQVVLLDSSALVDSEYTLEFQVEDGGGLTDTATVTIEVEANEPPVVNNRTFTVKEYAQDDWVVGTVTASAGEGDTDDEVTYAIIAGNDDGIFTIDPETGTITILNNTNLSAASGPYTLTIQVTDLATATDTATITINVDENKPPIVLDGEFTIKDYAQDETIVGQIQAAAPSSDTGDELTYTILAGNDDGIFGVNEDGEIYILDNTNLDAGVTSQYVLTVQVSDLGNATDTATFTIDIEANLPPVIADQTFTVKDYADNESNVGEVVASAPASETNDSVTYTILSGNESGVFAIDPDTGEITVADNSTLDATTTPQYVLVVQVADLGGATATAEITINAEANQAPVLNNETFEVSYQIADNAQVGVVTATDADPGQTLTYAITAGNDDGLFAIDPNTGKITVLDSSTFVDIAPITYELTVEVTDSLLLTDTATITIDVESYQPPTAQNATFLVRDNAANGTVIGEVTASDTDTGDTLTYAITNYDGGDAAFAIDASTGQITVADRTALDAETQTFYTLTVTVTDDHDLSTEATIIINISGMNDAPIIDIDDQTMSYTDDTLEVALPGEDAEGDPIEYTAEDITITYYDPDYDLKTELGLTRYAKRYYNKRGANEKYFASNTGTFYLILPNGDIYDTKTETLQGTVNSDYYTNPTALLNLTQPVLPEGFADPILSFGVNGTTVTINPPEGYTGTFKVNVKGFDGEAEGEGSFTVTVVNNAPEINDVNDVSISHNDTIDPINIGPLVDADGEEITYEVVITNTSDDALAFALKEEFSLVRYLPQYDDYRGVGKKWLKDENNVSYYILPNGEVYRYKVSEKVGDVALEYYDDPQSLIDLAAPAGPDVTVTLANVDGDGDTEIDPNYEIDTKQLTLTVGNADFEGTFTVEITATSGEGDSEQTSTATFDVNITNAEAEINSIPDKDYSVNDEPEDIDLGDATDADGDSVTYTFTLLDHQPAYDLKTELGLTTYYPKYDNYKGITRKLIRAADKTWYSILPSGEIYNYKTNELMGQVDAAYFDNPEDLLAVEANPAPVDDSFITIAGQTMTIRPTDANYDGTFIVEVTATDATGKTSTQTFLVTITDHAPEINEVEDQVISYRDNPKQTAVSVGEVTDADGDAVTYSVEFTNPALDAWNLRNDLQLLTYIPKYDNLKGNGGKWFKGADKKYYYILETGEVFKYKVAGAIGQLDTAYYDDPQSLIDLADVDQPGNPNAAAGWEDIINGDVISRELTITVQNASYIGTFRVTVTATSGLGEDAQTTTYSFDVIVKNSEPEWQTTPADQTIYSYTGNMSKTVTYLATDFDSADSIIYSAQINTELANAYDLQSRLLLTRYNPKSDNRVWGVGEHMYYSAYTGAYYGILPSGNVLKRQTHTVSVGYVDTYYYDNPYAIFYVSELYAPANVHLAWNGNELTVTAPADFTGTFQIDVEATDGENVITDSFKVTVY